MDNQNEVLSFVIEAHDRASVVFRAITGNAEVMLETVKGKVQGLTGEADKLSRVKPLEIVKAEQVIEIAKAERGMAALRTTTQATGKVTEEQAAYMLLLDDRIKKANEGLAAHAAASAGAGHHLDMFSGAVLGLTTVVGVEGVKLSVEWQKMRANVASQTGLAGKDLDAFMGAVRKVSVSSHYDLGEIADAAVALRQRFKESPEEIEKWAEKFLTLSKVTRTEVGPAIKGVSDLMRGWRVPSSDMGETLDRLIGITQKTRQPLEGTLGVLTKFGPQLRSMGLDLKDSQALILEFAERGLDPTALSRGLNKAISSATKEVGDGPGSAKAQLQALQDQVQSTGQRLTVLGTQDAPVTEAALKRYNTQVADATDAHAKAQKALADYKTQLQQTGGVHDTVKGQLQGEIDALLGTKDANDRAALATTIFGGKAGPVLAEALSHGKRGLDDQKKSLDGMRDSTDKAGKELEDTLASKAEKAQHRVEDLARTFVDDLTPALKDLVDLLGAGAGALDDFANKHKTLAEIVGGGAAATAGASLLARHGGVLGAPVRGTLGKIPGLDAIFGKPASALDGSAAALDKAAEALAAAAEKLSVASGVSEVGAGENAAAGTAATVESDVSKASRLGGAAAIARTVAARTPAAAVGTLGLTDLYYMLGGSKGVQGSSADPGQNVISHIQDEAVSAKEKVAQVRLALKAVNDQLAGPAGQDVSKVGALKASQKALADYAKDLSSGVASQDRWERMMSASFAQMATNSKGSLNDIRKAAASNATAITSTLNAGSSDAKVLLTQNFSAAADAVQKQMDRAGGATKEGTSLIHKYLAQALEAIGYSPSETRAYFTDTKAGGKSAFHAGDPGVPGHARGGFYVGLPGQRGQDNVPAVLNGRRAVVAEGEYVGVFNHDQQQGLSHAVAQTFGMRGGLPEFMQTVNSPHGLAGGSALHAAAGVVLDAGVNMSVGREPQIRRDLEKLSDELGQTVYVISGYRTPAHSVEVGGFADDPHTRGEAADIGVGSPSLASMFGVKEEQLKAVGLYRPFYPASAHEVNHVQLLGGGPTGDLIRGHASAAVAAATDAATTAVKHYQRQVLKNVTVNGLGGDLGNVVQASLDRLHAAAQAASDRAYHRTDGADGYSGVTGGGRLIDVGDLSKVNHTYPRHITGTPGAQFSPNLVKRIAQWAGLPADTFTKIAHGESSYEPGVVQRDPGDGNVGWGLWQMTPHAWGGPGNASEKYMNSLGGLEQMLNPLKNAKMAKFLLDHATSQTPNTRGFPWYGTQFLAGGGVVPGFAGAFAKGGSVTANKPTMALFGENGEETAFFMPKGSALHAATGAVVHKDQYDGHTRTGASGLRETWHPLPGGGGAYFTQAAWNTYQDTHPAAKKGPATIYPVPVTVDGTPLGEFHDTHKDGGSVDVAKKIGDRVYGKVLSAILQGIREGDDKHDQASVAALVKASLAQPKNKRLKSVAGKSVSTFTTVLDREISDRVKSAQDSLTKTGLLDVLTGHGEDDPKYQFDQANSATDVVAASVTNAKQLKQLLAVTKKLGNTRLTASVKRRYDDATLAVSQAQVDQLGAVGSAYDAVLNRDTTYASTTMHRAQNSLALRGIDPNSQQGLGEQVTAAMKGAMAVGVDNQSLRAAYQDAVKHHHAALAANLKKELDVSDDAVADARVAWKNLADQQAAAHIQDAATAIGDNVSNAQRALNLRGIGQEIAGNASGSVAYLLDHLSGDSDLIGTLTGDRNDLAVQYKAALDTHNDTLAKQLKAQLDSIDDTMASTMADGVTTVTQLAQARVQDIATRFNALTQGQDLDLQIMQQNWHNAGTDQSAFEKLKSDQGGFLTTAQIATAQANLQATIAQIRAEEATIGQQIAADQGELTDPGLGSNDQVGLINEIRQLQLHIAQLEGSIKDQTDATTDLTTATKDNTQTQQQYGGSVSYSYQGQDYLVGGSPTSRDLSNIGVGL